MKIFIESTAGDRFECELEADTPVGTIAADFFESMGWPEQDGMGRGQRAVVELAMPPGFLGNKKSRRLKSELTLVQAEVPEGAVLRIFPESIAGALDPRLRNEALVKGRREIETLCENDDYLDFEANDPYRPDWYKILIYYRTFSNAPHHPKQAPPISDENEVEIQLTANFPLEPPIAQWVTPIFHPNIDVRTGGVCLGQLKASYAPSMGLGRLVSMLVEMAQWHNFDVFDSLNGEAKVWASNPDNWDFIKEIGGSPFQVPRHILIKPSNWGTNAPLNSPFYGQIQPAELSIEWAMEQARSKTKFTKTN